MFAISWLGSTSLLADTNDGVSGGAMATVVLGECTDVFGISSIFNLGQLAVLEDGS